jgi:aspartyl-tRNA(Asn)/glutamyl-tRNA(Gln) amidotransferase subunit B
MRSKEDANDYRYFPDPDLLPLVVDETFIDAARVALPELPQAKCARFAGEYGLSPYDATVLTSTREMSEYFEKVVASLNGEAKLVANWLMGDLSALLNRDGKDIADSPISSKHLAGLLKRVKDGMISSKAAKEVFFAMWAGEGDADTIIEARGLKQVSDSGEIEEIVDEVLAANPQMVAEFKAGKEKAFNALVGQTMKASKGKANPAQVNEILGKKLA